MVGRSVSLICFGAQQTHLVCAVGVRESNSLDQSSGTSLVFEQVQSFAKEKDCTMILATCTTVDLALVGSDLKGQQGQEC